MKKCYNKAEEKVHNLKKDVNSGTIKVVYEDGRNVPYPIKQKFYKKTQEKIDKFNT